VQWSLIEPLLPPPATSGRAEKRPRREIVNAILYLGPGQDAPGCCPSAYLLTAVRDGLLALCPLEN